MSIVLPLLFTNARDSQIFLEELRDPASDVARLLALPASLDTPVHVVSTSQDVAQTFKAAGFSTLLIDPPASEPSFGLAPGAAAALKALLQVGRVTPDEIVVVGDALGFHVQASLLLQALELSRKSQGQCHATLSEVRDHPVQLHLPFRIYALDLLALPDASAHAGALLAKLGLDPSEHAISHPFFMDWRDMDIWECAPTIYAAAPEQHSARLRLWRVDDTEALADEFRLLYIWESLSTARRLLPKAQAKRYSRGFFPTYAHDGTVPIRLVPASDGGWLCQIETTALPAGSRLFLWRGPGHAPDVFVEVILPDERFRGEEATPWFCCASWPSAKTPQILYACIVAPSTGPEYDFTEPVCGGENLWETDPCSGLRVHPGTCKPFANRQDFPQLFQMDGALAASSVEALLNLPHGPLPCRLPLAPKPRLTQRLAADASEDLFGSNLWTEDEDDRAFGEWGLAAEGIYRLAQSSRERMESMAAASVSERQMEEAYWKYQQMAEMAHRLPTSTPRHDRMILFASNCTDKLIGLRELLRSTLLRMRQEHHQPSGTPSGRPPQAPPLTLQQIPLPGDQLRNPCHLASDNVQSLFISCMDFDWNGGLFRKDLESGETRLLCDSKRIYNGLWFDPKQQVLYAALIRLDGREACAIEVLDMEGRRLATAPLLTPSGKPQFMPTLFSGDHAHLYFIGGRCKTLVVIDKASLRIANLLLLPNAELNWDVVPGNGGLYTSAPLLHTLQRIAPDGSLLTRNSDMHTVYPRLLCIHPETGEVFSLQIDRQPVALEELDQCISTYTPSLSFVSEYAIDSGTAIDIHIMSTRSLLLVADFVNGLRLYDIKPLAGTKP